jgi:hypothetical protein
MPGQEHISRQVRTRTAARLPATGHDEWHSHLHSMAPNSSRSRRGLSPPP